MFRLIAIAGVVGVIVALSFAETPATAPADGVIRMKAGQSKPFTDPHGHVWQEQKGFPDGDDVERDSDLKIQNTDMPAFYRTEHYDMTSWSVPVPNGTYTVKLYFCETYEDVTKPGERVFDVKIGQQQLKDFDIVKEAGSPLKPVTKTFDGVNVTDGVVKVVFTANVQSPCINGIEIIPKK